MQRKIAELEENAEAGTIMVDALVAVVIVSMMASVCLVTLQISRRASTSASTDRSARLTLQSLIETTPRIAGVYKRKTGNSEYAVTVSEQVSRDATLCVLRAQVRQGRRIRQLEATRWCDPTRPL